MTASIIKDIASLCNALGINGLNLHALLPNASYSQATSLLKEAKVKIPQEELEDTLELLERAEELGVLPVSPRSRTLPVMATVASLILEEERTLIYEQFLEEGGEPWTPELLDAELEADVKYAYKSDVVDNIKKAISEEKTATK